MVAKLRAKRAARKAAPKVGRRGTVPYYNQTADFTCGPSSLLMAMKALDPETDFSRTHEFLLWREATTVFMGGPGPGGCAAAGLALAAHRRGFDVEVWVNHRDVLLGERPKTAEGAKVMALMQKADLAEMKRQEIPYHLGARTIADLRNALADGALPIVLVDTDYIHGDPCAHWVVVTGVDDRTVTINDPWMTKDKGHTPRTMTDHAVSHAAFRAMTAYGRRKERATVLVRKR